MEDENTNSRRKHHGSTEHEAEESTKRRKHRHHHHHHHHHHHRSSRKHRDIEKDKELEELRHSLVPSLSPTFPQPEVITASRPNVRTDYDMEEGEIIEDDNVFGATEMGQAFEDPEVQNFGLNSREESRRSHGLESSIPVENISGELDVSLVGTNASQNINMDGATVMASYHEPDAAMNHHGTLSACLTTHVSSDISDRDYKKVQDVEYKTYSSSSSMDEDCRRLYDQGKSKSRNRSLSQSIFQDSASPVTQRAEASQIDSLEFGNELRDERTDRESKAQRHGMQNLIERECEHLASSGRYRDDRGMQWSRETRDTDKGERELDREMEKDRRSDKSMYKGLVYDRKSKERSRSQSRDRKREVYHERERREQWDRREEYYDWKLEERRDRIRDRSTDKYRNYHKEKYISTGSRVEEHGAIVRGRSRGKSEERERHHQRERNGERLKERNDRDNYKEKERYGDYYRERERGGDKSRERERGKDRDREREIGRVKDKGKNSVRDRSDLNSRKSDNVDDAKYFSKQYEMGKFGKSDIANGIGAKSFSICRDGNAESNKYDLELEEREILTIMDQEEEDLKRIKEESKRLRVAILEKYKAQPLKQEVQCHEENRGNGTNIMDSICQSAVTGNALPETGDERSDGAEFNVTEFSVAKSPVQNGTLDVQRPFGSSGLGEGTPKSETADMFCDDIFGESPEFRKSGKGDELIIERSGLHDNWDDAEGYYSYRFGELLDGRYEVTAAHGKGVFSTVVRSKDLKAGTGDLNEVAIKIIRNNETMYKAGMQELVILKKLVGADLDNRRHCVRFISHFKYRNHLCLVFESLHMNLREVLKKFGRNIGLKLTAVRTYAKQLFIALKHLRNCGVLHCDIKPDNMVVNEAKNVLKLCDFGNAMFAGKNEITPYLVSRFYRAPEIILGLPYDHPLDIWSVGCCIYELYTGKVLFPGPSNNDMLRLHMELKGQFPKKMLRKGAFTEQHFDQDLNFHATEEDPVTKKSIKRLVLNIKQKDIGSLILHSPGEDPKMLSNFKDLLDKIFVLDPEKRMTVSQALNHPFITGK